MTLMWMALIVCSAPQQEFIFEAASFPSCHASTLAETPNEDILAAWFGGTDEGERDVGIWLSRRGPQGWSPPTKVASDSQCPCWNPVLCIEGDQGSAAKPARVWLFYKVGRTPESWSGAYKTSEDGGKTFSEAVLLPAGILGPVKNKPLVTPEGHLLCGSSVESYATWAAWVEDFDPRQGTWQKYGPIVVPENLNGIIQPTLIPGDLPGSYRMFTRATRAIGKICVSDSKDGGKSWSPARPTSLPNPNSGIDAVRLVDGRVVLVHNDTPSGRTPLNVSLSPDLGETWKPAVVLENDPGEYSYPAVIQLRSGDVATTYTWRRERIRFVRISLAELNAVLPPRASPPPTAPR